MVAVVDIYNMALGQVGVDTGLSSPTENSYEAEQCTLYYELVRKQALSAAHWPAARAAFRLNLAATKDTTTAWMQGDPEPGWTYAYSLPSDYLHARHLSDYGLFQLSAYTNSGGTVAKGLVSNQQNAVLVYTRDLTDPNLWDPNLVLAVKMALAAFIAKPLTGKKDLYQLLVQDADRLIRQARTVVANSEEYNNERLPEWLEARQSSFRPAQQQTYVWPHGPLFSEQAIVNT